MILLFSVPLIIFVHSAWTSASRFASLKNVLLMEIVAQPRRLAVLISAAVGIALTSFPLAASAQANSRSSFPGRRVGAGTRGECSSRILAHLVPDSSVFSPGDAAELALVQGPTANPASLTMTFKSETGGAPAKRTLPASPAAFIVVKESAITAPTVWESEFDCGAGDAGVMGDSLAFVTTTSPPAVSLLVPTPDPSDALIQKAIKSLRQSCGTTVPAAATLAQFGLADIVTADWPQQLPVRCPS